MKTLQLHISSDEWMWYTPAQRMMIRQVMSEYINEQVGEALLALEDQCNDLYYMVYRGEE